MLNHKCFNTNVIKIAQEEDIRKSQVSAVTNEHGGYLSTILSRSFALKLEL